jgi:hypothetical protein
VAVRRLRSVTSVYCEHSTTPSMWEKIREHAFEFVTFQTLDRRPAWVL